MKQLDLGWVIGILEGEGTFYVADMGNRDYGRRIGVRSTDEWTVRHLQELIPEGRLYPPYENEKRTLGKKPMWAFQLCRWDVQSRLLPKIIPHLSPRRQVQAQRILDHPPKSA